MITLWGRGATVWMSLAVAAGCGSVGSHATADAGASDTDGATADAMVLPCAPTPAGISARWRAEASTNDDVGTYNGVQVGHLAYTSGRHGAAFMLNGTDALVSIDDGEKLWPADSFSVEGWVNATKIAANKRGRIVVKYDCGDACPRGVQSLWSLEIAPDAADATGTIGHAQFSIRTSAGKSIVLTDAVHANIIDRAWHHVVGVRDNTAKQATLYVDGVAAAKLDNLPDEARGELVDGDQLADPITIGATRIEAQTTYDEYLTGAVDDVAYFGVALTADQIQAIYSSRDGECR